MDFTLREDQKLVIQTVRRYLQEEIIPLERTLDPDAYELPEADYRRLVDKTKGMGLYQMSVPTEYGGGGMDLLTYSLVIEELAQHRSGLYEPAYWTFGREPPAPLFAGNEFQKENYLIPVIRGEKTFFWGITEPSGGSDPARAIETKAVRDGDFYILNGNKMFNSRADTSDFGVIFARTDSSRGRHGISCFIVDTDTPGFTVKRHVQVLRSHYTTELVFEDMKVPATNLLGDEGRGFAAANDLLVRARMPYSAACIGVAVAAHKMTVEFAKNRSTFNEVLANRQAVQWMLVENEMEIRRARFYVIDAAAKANRGEPFRFEASMAKLFSTEMAGRVLDRCIQIHGGIGVTKDLPLERWWREMRIRRIGEGPSEVHRIVMARDILSDMSKSSLV